MEQITQIFTDAAYFQLSALLAGGLFFFMVGLRELTDEQFYGYFFGALGFFFFCLHAVFLFSLPAASSPLQHITVWQWLIAFMAPALIALFLLFGFFNMLMSHVRAGMVKVFFGLTLLCYLFMLGGNWPSDVRGILVLIWSMVWFDVELSTAS